MTVYVKDALAGSAAALVNGALARSLEFSRDNEEEIRDRIKNTATNALLGTAPTICHKLLGDIRAFQGDPSQVKLDCLRAYLPPTAADDEASGFTADLSPIMGDSVNSIIHLAALVHRIRAEEIQQPTLDTVNTLNSAAEALETSIKKHEGVIPQLRKELNACADPSLRTCVAAMNAYRSALEQRAPAATLIPLIQTVRNSCDWLLTHREGVPQINADAWEVVNTWKAQLNIPPASVPRHEELYAQSEAIHALLTDAFKTQRGIVEETTDLLAQGAQRSLGIIPELRRALNACADPSLRTCVAAMNVYRSALEQHAPTATLIPLMQKAHDACDTTHQEGVPQISADEWGRVNTWKTQLNIQLAGEHLPPHAELYAQAEAAHTILEGAFKAQRGIIEESTDLLVDGINRGLNRVVTVPTEIVQHAIASAQGAAPAAAAAADPAAGVGTGDAAAEPGSDSASEAGPPPKEEPSLMSQMATHAARLAKSAFSSATAAPPPDAAAASDAGSASEAGAPPEEEPSLVSQVAEHAARLAKSAFAPAPRARRRRAAAESGSESDAEPKEESSFLSQLTAHATSLLNNALSSAGNTLSQYAAHNVAAMLLYTFRTIREHVQQAGTHPDLLPTIDQILSELGSVNEQTPWATLKKVVQKGIKFIREQQVYFQGMRLPLGQVRAHTTSAIPAFLNAIDAHQKALQPNSHEQKPQEITPQMIQQRANTLKMRAASYGSARFVLEKICRLQMPSSFYAETYRPSADPRVDNLSPIFRARIFKAIDASKKSAALRWCAKKAYDLTQQVTRFYINSIIDGILKDVTQWIDDDSPRLESKEGALTKLIRNWMAVTSGAYNAVAGAPASQSKDFDLMMEEALKAPERNGGLSQKQLFNAVAKTALDKFGPQIDWSSQIDRRFKLQISSKSPLSALNPALKRVNQILGGICKGIIFLPQWIGNKALQGSTKLALSYTTSLQHYAEQTIDSLRYNTPSSYAVQCMLFRQQQKILKLLQENLGKKNTAETGLMAHGSQIDQLEMKNLIEYAIEMVAKSACHTQDSLNRYLKQEDPLRNRIVKELERSFTPEVVEIAVETVAITLQAVTNKAEMRQILYDTLLISNDAFDASHPISEKQFAAITEGVRRQTDQLLETSLFHAIQEKFDFTNKNQKADVAQFNVALKEQTKNLRSKLHALANPIAKGSSLSCGDLGKRIIGMVQASKEYHSQRVDALAGADGNRNFHTETKLHFNAVETEHLRQCKPLSDNLNTMKAHVDEMLFAEKMLSSLTKSHEITKALSNQLGTKTPSSDRIHFLKTQLLQIQHQLNTLKNEKGPTSLTKELEQKTQVISSKIDTLEKLHAANLSLGQAHSQLKNLVHARLTTQQPSPKLLEKLSNTLSSLPSSAAVNEMQAIATKLMAPSSTPDTVRALQTQFKTILAEYAHKNQAASKAQSDALHTLCKTHSELLSRSMNQFSKVLTKNRATLHKLAKRVIASTDAIHSWTKKQHDLPIWEAFAFDMDWITETLKNLAFDRAKSRITLILDSLHRRYNYIGLVDQTLLLPFLEKHGRRHLKAHHSKK